MNKEQTMPIFNFKDYTLELNIAGTSVVVNCSSELSDRITDYASLLTTLSEQVAKKEKNVSDAITVFRTLTDDILGQGRFEEIFKSRKPTVYDCADVLLFLITEIKKHITLRREQAE